LSTESWIDIAVAVVALFLVGAAALVEASLASKSRMTLRELFEGRVGSQRAQTLLDQPQAVRSTMFLVALVGTFVYTAVCIRLLARDTSGVALLLGVSGSVLLLVALGRAVPLALAARFDAEDSRLIGRLAGLLAFVIAPVGLLVQAVALGTAKLAGSQPAVNGHNAVGDAPVAHDDDRAEEHDLEEDEQEMISGILGMEEDTVREIMVPRPDVVAVPIDMSIPNVVEVARQAGHSRIPVYQDSIDRIAGVVYAKDLLKFVHEDASSARLAEHMRPAFFVPESKRVDELLRDLKISKVHLAIVVDEYGGTAGLVTIEDILEEIVGEIQDEYDRETPLFEQVAPGEAIVDGRMSVEELAELFDAGFARDENGTVGGFVQRRLGRIPVEGETIHADGLTIEVQAVENHRVRKVRVALDSDSGTVESAYPSGSY
jgi:putative hemolysin